MSDLVEKYKREAEGREKEREEWIKKVRAGSEDRERKAEERKKKTDAEIAVYKESEIDPAMLENLTTADWLDYTCPYYKLERLEGDWIAKFDRKVREGGITVIEKFRNFIEEHRVPMRGMDPRTGIYGIQHAAAGFYSAGTRYMEQERWDEAIANFAKAIELQPRHVPARGYKAKCYCRKGDFVRASAEVWNAINLNPVMIMERTRETLGSEMISDPEGHKLYTNMLLEHLLIRAACFLAEELWEDAFMDFEEITKRKSDILNAYHGRLVVYMKFAEYYKFDEWDKIISNADMCIRRDYEKAFALSCRGVAYAELEKYDEAISDLTASLDLTPDQERVYANRASCYYNKGEYEKAVADAAEAIRLGDDTEDGYYNRALAYTKLGEYEKAFADFDEALRRFDREDERYEFGDEDYIIDARQWALDLMTGVSKPEE